MLEKIGHKPDESQFVKSNTMSVYHVVSKD